MTILDSFKSLGPSSSKSQVDAVLTSIINASPLAFTPSARVELIQLLLASLKHSSTGSKQKIASLDPAQALLAVKTLGRIPAGSEELSRPENLSLLLSLSISFKDSPAATSEALRCIANALLLIEEARYTWIKKQVGGGQASVDLLEKSSNPEQMFLASRILFLCTASSAHAGPFIRSLIEGKGDMTDVIGQKLEFLLTGIVTAVPLSKEAMTDLLKLSFNLLLHYPKLVDTDPPEDDTRVLGDCWSSKLDGFLYPLLRMFNSLPPTFPNPLSSPLTHVIHALISIPFTDSLRPIWFPPSPPPSRGSSSGNSSPVSKSTRPPSSRPGSPANRMDKALSVLTAGRRSVSRSPSPLPLGSRTSSSHSHPTDTFLRAHDLLEVSFSHYLPGSIEPDDMSVRDKVKAEADQSLDDLLSPLVVLITRLCNADESCRTRLRDWLVPADLDRTEALETRPDLLGRCLRLLGCVYHERLKNAVGEMLYVMCDSDASILSALVGYGNVAGFLFNKGVMSAPPPPTSSSTASTANIPADDNINPITGSIDRKTDLPEMTDEEKEREAEKLFVLFDRLEKTGAIPPSQNPIRKAVAEGKLG